MLLIFLFLTYLFPLHFSHLLINKENSTHSILTFGSCSKFDYDDPIEIFLSVSKLKPDLYMWLGIFLYYNKISDNYEGDAAYVEDIIFWYGILQFPGVKKARIRLNNTKNDPSK